jgi:hypothetical protein
MSDRNADYMRDYNKGGFTAAIAMAAQPIWGASSASNYLICYARQTQLVEADRKRINELAAELEVMAGALRSVAASPVAKPVLMQAAE